jgi:hypothetical protein
MKRRGRTAPSCVGFPTYETKLIETRRIVMAANSDPIIKPIESRVIEIPAACVDLATAPPDMANFVRFWDDLVDAVIATVSSHPTRLPEDPVVAIKRFERFLLQPVTPGQKATKRKRAIPPGPPRWQNFYPTPETPTYAAWLLASLTRFLNPPQPPPNLFDIFGKK